MKFAIAFVVAGLVPIAASLAQTAEPSAGRTPAAAATSAPSADGEVRKIDREQGKLTLRHGRIENLDMPGMTMVFRVADPRMLEALKVGDKVRFSAENVNGALTVTSIEAAD